MYALFCIRTARIITHASPDRICADLQRVTHRRNVWDAELGQQTRSFYGTIRNHHFTLRRFAPFHFTLHQPVAVRVDGCVVQEATQTVLYLSYVLHPLTSIVGSLVIGMLGYWSIRNMTHMGSGPVWLPIVILAVVFLGYRGTSRAEIERLDQRLHRVVSHTEHAA